MAFPIAHIVVLHLIIAAVLPSDIFTVFNMNLKFNGVFAFGMCVFEEGGASFDHYSVLYVEL
jgi:hypothetical protein